MLGFLSTLLLASEMIVKLPGIVNVMLLQNRCILIELAHGYRYAYVVRETCYLLYLQSIMFSSILLSGDIEHY